MSNLMINQLNGGASITATTVVSLAVLPIQLPATASVPNLTVPMTVTTLASFVGAGAGFGNMALQNATTVAITGGAISGTPISGASGNFTNISSSASVSFGTSSVDYVTLGGSGAGGLLGTNAGPLNIAPAGGTTQFTGNAVVSSVVQAFNGTTPPSGGNSSQGIFMSSLTNFGIFFGSSAPTASAPQGSLYLRTDGTSSTSRAYINSTGSTVWVGLLTTA